MKKRITIIAGIIAVAALVAVPLAFAGPHGHGGGAHGFGFFGGRHLERIAEELKLSDQQVDQIKAIFADLHEQNAQYRGSMHDTMKSVTETLLKNPNDVAAAQAIIDQQTANERAMKTNMLNATAKALSVLTPDQRAQLGTMIEERASRWEKRRQ